MPDKGKRLEGKVALITGGASGLGKGIARRFLSEGARVMLVDISEENLAAVAQELGPGVATIKADVSIEQEIEAAVAATVEKFGRLDAAVNSAGVGSLGRIVDMDVDTFAYVIDVDLKGILICLKHEAGQMIKQGNGGSIVNVASLNSRMPAIGLAPYCTAKAGVEMLTKVAALEMGSDKIRVNAISPGLVDTAMTNGVIAIDSIYHGFLDNTPLGRIGTTEDIAALALFLVSDEATWITGDNILIDGGQHTMSYPDEEKLIIENAERESEA